MLPILILAGALLALVLVTVALTYALYTKVDQGAALIISKVGSEPTVSFTGGVVLPIIHRAEQLDISLRTIEVVRRGRDGVVCNDNIRADIKVAFYVRVNDTREDVLKVARTLGCARASDPEVIRELFEGRFSEALKTVAKQFDFEDLFARREEAKDHILEMIGRDLSGFILDDAVLDEIEQTPIEHLDANNILDAQGIHKITQFTALAKQLSSTQDERDALRDERDRLRELVNAARDRLDDPSFSYASIDELRALLAR